MHFFSFIYCIFSTLLHVSVPQGHPQGVLTVNDQALTQYGTISALDGGVWWMPRHGHFIPGKAGTHRIGGWVGPRDVLDRCGKSRPHRYSIPRPSSPWRLTTNLLLGKGKVFPLQAWAGPWGSGRLRLWIFSTFGTTKEVRSSPLRTGRLYSQVYPGTHFQRLSRPQGTWFRR